MEPATIMGESDEARLVRLEAAREAQVETNRLLTPLPAEYAVQREQISSLRSDLNKGLDAIRAEIAEIKKDAVDRAKERRTMLLALIVCGVGLFGTFVATAVPLLKGAPAPIVREAK